MSSQWMTPIPVRRQKPGRETLLCRAVIALLQKLGCVAWRHNVGAMQQPNADGTRRWVRFGQKGMPDVFGVICGQAIAVECKVDGNKSTPEQVKMQRTLAAHGALVYRINDEITADDETMIRRDVAEHIAAHRAAQPWACAERERRKATGSVR